MPNPETLLQQQIRLAVSDLGAVLFRNNRGVARYARGADQCARVEYGLIDGAADLVGYTPMTGFGLGRRLPVWTEVEVKTPTGRLTKAQAAHLAGVARDGGLAIVARSVADATGPIRRALDGDTGVLGVVHGLSTKASTKPGKEDPCESPK